MDKQRKSARTWAKLREVFLSKKGPSTKLSPISLFTKGTLHQDEHSRLLSYQHGPYHWVCFEKSVELSVAAIKSASDQSVDSTGWWVWPAEELLAYYVLTHCCSQKYASVLELGAGSSGMAGLCAYLRWQPEKVKITDGKLENLGSISRTLRQSKLEGAPIEVEQLVWGSRECGGKYQLILAADCLFFEKYHSDLIATLKEAMSSESVAVFLNPKRGQSADKFLKLAVEEGFKYTSQPLTKALLSEEYEKYACQLAQSQQYDPEQHNYYLTRLTLQ